MVAVPALVLSQALIILQWEDAWAGEMPVRGGAVWKLASGDFDYYQWEILDVETNRAALWGAD